MFRLYSEKKIMLLVERYAPWIEEVSGRCGLPGACMKAVLRREMREINVLDLLADALVALNFLRCDLRRALYRRRLVRTPEPRPRRGMFGKLDSSTGYAQIFGRVAVNAANYALDRGLAGEEELGLAPGKRPSPDSLPDRERMWRRLLTDRRFNIRMGILNLAAAGEEINGHTDYAHYTPEEYKRMFTRYNANTRAVTPYGEEVYRYFLEYSRDKIM